MDYNIKGKEYRKKRQNYKKPENDYGREVPVVELEPLMDSVPLERDFMPYGLRGFWIVGDRVSYHSGTDRDSYRVVYHEDLHRKLSRWDRNHPEWLVKLIEDWRLGPENYN